MMAWSSWAPRLPTKIIPTLEGDRRTRSAVAAEEAWAWSMARYLGTACRTAVRYFGTARMTITPATTRTVRTSRGYPPDEESVEDVAVASLPASRDASPDRLIITMSRTWTTNPQTLSITPMETAPPASMPLRPKKRISRASLAAELGTARAMNWMAYSSMRTGPNRRGRNEAPRVPTACGTGITGDSANATASHPEIGRLELLDQVGQPDVGQRGDDRVGDQPDQHHQADRLE